MGFIQLLASLWPFLKEMFVGEKIQDSTRSQRDGSGGPQSNRRDGPAAAKVARWLIDKMQKSRRFLACIITLLIVSLFVNYKVIGKLSAVMPREEEHAHAGAPAPKEPKEVPTVPREDKSERDILLEQTVRELKNLYGESR